MSVEMSNAQNKAKEKESADNQTADSFLHSRFILGCVSKVESMTAERKNLQNQKEIRAECRIFL